MTIGGIQTYITNLIPLLRDAGYAVTVYQHSDREFHKDLGQYDVYGVVAAGLRPAISRALQAKMLQQIDMKSDLLVYGCETFITERIPCRSIAVQHGISWDVPFGQCSRLRYFRHYLGKCYLAWKTMKRVSKVDRLVCVDYNFVNWYRATAPYTLTQPKVIPNFSVLPPDMPQKEKGGTVNIIFARRLAAVRGPKVFADVAARLLERHQPSSPTPDTQHPTPNTHHPTPNSIHITIAGTGQESDYMHRVLDKFENVSFISYDSEDSLKIHAAMDIAVVPTLASEGTSLSLLEAMASGCAVVCTDVGGMTNIVLDKYNGMMTAAGDADGLYAAIDYLIDHPEERRRMAATGYETVRQCFSHERWAKAWKKVIEEASNTQHPSPNTQ